MAVSHMIQAAPLESRSEEFGWKALSTVSAIAGGIVTRKLVSAVYAALSREEVDPPLNPADRRIGWSDAVPWAIAAGVGAGIGRLVSQRVAAAGWERATGSSPPGMVT
jgi:hypothetical protein